MKGDNEKEDSSRNMSIKQEGPTVRNMKRMKG
jgi:hypothetical protein